MGGDLASGSYSSTARLSASDARQINEFVEAGYFPSRARFVIEALRDTAMKFVRDQDVMYDALLELDQPLVDSLGMITNAMRRLYIEKTGYDKKEKEKPVILVNITGHDTFMNYAIDTIKDCLGFKDLQDVVSFVVFLKIKEVTEFKNNVESLTSKQGQLNTKALSKLPPDKVEEFLIKTGMLRKE